MLAHEDRYLLVDLSNVTFRAVHSHSALEHDGKFTGGVYGFLQIVCKLINDHSINRLVVADDTKPYFRTKAYPAYKGNRSKPADYDRHSVAAQANNWVLESKQYIRDLLSVVGTEVLAKRGYEADDIIAHAAILPTLFPNSDKVYIASNDTDLYQILLKHNRIFLCHKKGLYGYHEFKAEYGLEPCDWARVLAIAGSHNGVPGIKGIGLKTAAKLVREKVTNRHLAYKYKVDATDILLRWRLSCYPWHELNETVPCGTSKPIKYNRRQMIAWTHRRFGIDFAPYMQTAFEALTK